MSKKFFSSKILDIKDYRLNYILRDDNENTRILLDEPVSKEYINSLRNIFFRSREHVTGDLIDYKEFLRLYEIYSGKLSEKQFSEKVLFISNGNLKEIREKEGRKTNIFANLKLSDAYIATLKSKIVNNNLLYYRQSITPKFFRRLYKQIRTVLSEADFAKEILEVNRQVYSKICVRGEGKYFRILSISGTEENKSKFFQRQEKNLKSLLEGGFSYSEIEEITNLASEDLLEKVQKLYESGINKEEVKEKYIFRRLKQGKDLEKERIQELKITKKDIKAGKKKIEEQIKFEDLENRCKRITDEILETKNTNTYLRKYIELCKEKYDNNFSDMSTDTLECIQSTLEFLEDSNMENIKFFVQACIGKKDFRRANGFITFLMQTPKLKNDTKKDLNELRTHVRHAVKKNDAINMFFQGNNAVEIKERTGLTEIEVLELVRKLQSSNVKLQNL